MATKVSTDVNSINETELEQKVKDMYSEVALNPHGEFHFEMGRVLAERLGYLSEDLDRIPAEAIDSFAGVGYYFHLINLHEGESVIDLGSGSGVDTFVAALKVGKNGKVVGVDMTDEQRAKAERLRDQAGFNNVTYLKSYIDAIPCEDGSFDAAISNGVINLVADKGRLFREAARILSANGRLAISDIVTEEQLPEGISCDTTLWAACIGGAMQQDAYRAAIEAAGLHVETVQENPQYKFISENARGASKKFGVKSISLLAVKV